MSCRLKSHLYQEIYFILEEPQKYKLPLNLGSGFRKAVQQFAPVHFWPHDMSHRQESPASLNHTMTHIWVGSRKWVFKHDQVLGLPTHAWGQVCKRPSTKDFLKLMLSPLEIGAHQASKTLTFVQTDSKQTSHSGTHLLSSFQRQD